MNLFSYWILLIEHVWWTSNAARYCLRSGKNKIVTKEEGQTSSPSSIGYKWGTRKKRQHWLVVTNHYIQGGGGFGNQRLVRIKKRFGCLLLFKKKKNQVMGKSVDVCCYRRVLARSLVHTDILRHTGGVPGLSNSPSRESGKENPTKIKRAELQNKK
jgi:hypothetical protein